MSSIATVVEVGEALLIRIKNINHTHKYKTKINIWYREKKGRDLTKAPTPAEKSKQQRDNTR